MDGLSLIWKNEIDFRKLFEKIDFRKFIWKNEMEWVLFTKLKIDFRKLFEKIEMERVLFEERNELGSQKNHHFKMLY